ncbi:MAG: hypothetical protein HY901_05795 [Deltaproteobacteria bacterium]|nr:hypothetical protein [Deltaproteobacteria bacterium]
MGKLILMSVVIASIAIPVRAARHPDPRRGLKRALVQTLLFDAVYVLAVLFIYPRI